MERCDECGFEYASEDERSIPERLRTLGRRYGAPLSRFLPGEDGTALLRTHPVNGAWSALEYACHMRDVFEVIPARVEQTLVEDRPRFEPMRRDERVLELAYAEQDPVEVSAAIAANADAAADLFEGLTAEQWARTGIANYPTESERTVLWLGQHLVHEAHHHLLDVGRTIRAARGALMTVRPPSDAVVALRSLERRFRGLFAGREHDESPDDLAHRIGPDGHAAVDHVVGAARDVTFLGRALEQALLEDDPALHPAVTDHAARDWGDTPEGPVEARLDELTAAAEALALRAERVSAEEWGRPARVAGSDANVSALDLLWDAVDSAVEHLRAAERTIDAVRGRG